jgi:hypothetical protein
LALVRLVAKVDLMTLLIVNAAKTRPGARTGVVVSELAAEMR